MCNHSAVTIMRRILLFTGFFITTPFVLIFSLLFLLFISYQQQTSGGLSFFGTTDNAIAYAALPSNINIVSDSIGQKDARVAQVASFLSEYNSPLTPYASYIVETADKYNINYKLIPAIAMQESIACKKEIPGTHNCWGYGIYGKKVTSFPSYEDAIDTITRYFANKKNNGIVTLDEIGHIYNPSNDNDWVGKVNLFMTEL